MGAGLLNVFNYLLGNETDITPACPNRKKNMLSEGKFAPNVPVSSSRAAYSRAQLNATTVRQRRCCLFDSIRNELLPAGRRVPTPSPRLDVSNLLWKDTLSVSSLKRSESRGSYRGATQNSEGKRQLQLHLLPSNELTCTDMTCPAAFDRRQDGTQRTVCR